MTTDELGMIWKKRRYGVIMVIPRRPWRDRGKPQKRSVTTKNGTKHLPNIVTCMSDYTLRLDWLLHSLNTTIHYSTHQGFSVCCIFTSRCLVTVSTPQLPQLPCSRSYWPVIVSQLTKVQTCHGPHRKLLNSSLRTQLSHEPLREHRLSVYWDLLEICCLSTAVV
jgi:hypothetical protein